jgi:hypothetical protein
LTTSNTAALSVTSRSPGQAPRPSTAGPLRVFFGAEPLGMMHQLYAERLKTWEQWADVAAEAQGAQG